MGEEHGSSAGRRGLVWIVSVIRVMLSGGSGQIRMGPFYYNYGLAPLCMTKNMTEDKGRRYIYNI